MNFGSTMNWTDIILLSILLFSGTVGVFRGFVSEVLSLLSWFFGIFLGFKYAATLGSFAEAYISISGLRNVICFFIIFVCVFVFFGFGKRLLAGIIAEGGIGFADRIFGLLFGFARGFVFICLMVFLGGLTTLTDEVWWQEARFSTPLERTVQAILVWSPSKFETNFNF